MAICRIPPEEMNGHQLWMQLLHEISETRKEIRNFVSLLNLLRDAGVNLTDEEVEEMAGRIGDLQKLLDRADSTFGQTPPTWKN